MLEVKLRDYQESLMNKVASEWSDGKNRVIAKCATGGGKGEMMAWITGQCVANKMYCVTIVRNRGLVNNASERYDKYKIPHGIYMPGSNRSAPSQFAQVCSVDTLMARQIFPHSDKNCILIIDEMQDAHENSDQYNLVMSKYKQIVGFTATPYSKLSNWDSCVSELEAYELRDLGVLSPAKYFCPNAQIDVTDVKTVAGEFNQKELFKASSGSKIVGDLTQSWIEFAQNRPTVLFAVNVEHSKMIAEEFNRRGVNAVHCDAMSSDKDRKKAANGLIDGSIKVITNVNIFARGWDCPPVSCIQDAQPTQSLIRHIQKWGRGLRPSLGKKDCIFIDNAGNIYRHGTPYRVHEVDLSKKDFKEKSKQLITLVNCKKCFFMYESDLDACPECGYAKEKTERKITNEEGELTEYLEAGNEEIRTIKVGACQSKIKELMIVAKRKGIPIPWVYKTVLNNFGEEISREAGVPENNINTWKRNQK